MSIEIIDETSRYLTEVKRLWRKNSEILGFFPQGAFEEYAAKRTIIAAVSPEKTFMGYLLFRVVRYSAGWPVAVIVHLCVARASRGKGIARQLVESLRRLTHDQFLRIALKCRRDFEVSKMWPTLGFTYGGDEAGRAGRPLGRWYIDLRDLPLMAFFRQKTLAKRFLAVIDSNVFFRLQDEIGPTTPQHEKILSEEAKALLEDWLGEDVALAITKETLNEIERNDNAYERWRRVSFSNEFHSLTCSSDAQERVCAVVKSYLPGTLSDNDKSDINQVSQAISGKAYCFITQDTRLLRITEHVEREFGTKIMTPGEFVGHVDELIREIQYRPVMFAGSRRLVKSAIRGRLPEDLYSQFRDSAIGEKKGEFESSLRAFMARPAQYDLQLCTYLNGKALVLVVYDRKRPLELSIPMLRVTWSSLTETVLRYVLRQIVMTSFFEKRSTIRITDRSCAESFREAFEEVGFSLVDKEYVKCNLPFVGTGEELSAQMNGQMDFPILQSLSDVLSRAVVLHDPVALMEIEHRLWPAKLLDSNIPNYIVSIKPGWAEHLFDEDLAAQTLLGAREITSLKSENVYYRRYRYPSEVRGPGRILWYVTKDYNHRNSMQLRACSLLEEVVIGKAKALFKRFQRLGVYEWTNVLRDTDGNPDASLMVLRFSNTEVFRHPISLETFGQIVRSEDQKSLCLQSPQPISSKAFAILYKTGMGIN